MNDVTRFLRRLRRLERRRLGLLAAVWLFAAVLAQFGILLIDVRLAGSSREDWWPAVRLASAVATLLVPTILVARAIVFPPSLSALAGVADREAALMDRLSTALEVAAPEPRTIAERLLVVDVADRVARLEADQIVRVWPRRRSVLMAAVYAAAVLAVDLGVIAAVAHAAPVASDGGTTPTSIADTSLALADLLVGDPRFEDDAYLQAVAKSFREFAASARSAKSVRGDLETGLRELLGHLYDALEGRDPTTRGLLREELDGLIPQLADETALSESVASTAKSRLDEEGALPQPLGPRLEQSAPMADPYPDRLQHALDAAVESLQEAKLAREQRRGADRAAVPSDIVNTYEFITSEMQAAIELSQAQEDKAFETAAAGVTIGASPDANDGGGDQAGDGAQPKLGNEGVPAPALSGGGQELVLPSGEREAEARRKSETLPLPGEPKGLEPTSVEAIEWEPIHQAQLSETLTIGLRHRDLISRYFMPGDR